MFIAHDPWEDIVQFQKVWYPRNQLVEIFQVKVVPKKIKKLGAPYYFTNRPNISLTDPPFHRVLTDSLLHCIG